MSEITQADRETAHTWWMHREHDERDLPAYFARHREAAAAEERAKIVAWLRDDADEVLNADGPVYPADLIAEAIVECAQAIAEGEHLK